MKIQPHLLALTQLQWVSRFRAGSRPFHSIGSGAIPHAVRENATETLCKEFSSAHMEKCRKWK
jgi:hypothetical protein